MFAVVAGFVAYALLGHGVPHIAAEALAVLVSAAVGLLVGLIAIGRPGTPPLASLIITLGLGIASYAVDILLWGDYPVSYAGLPGNVGFGEVAMERQYFLIVVVTAVTFGALILFFGRTYLGKALTACSSNPYAARLMGISVRRMGLIAFAIGGGLGGVAGVLLTPLQSVSSTKTILSEPSHASARWCVHIRARRRCASISG